jgi:hypothetical protein
MMTPGFRSRFSLKASLNGSETVKRGFGDLSPSRQALHFTGVLIRWDYPDSLSPVKPVLML